MSKPHHPLSDALTKRASRLRFPKLFGLVMVLLVIDVLLPDFVPFIDEIILGLLAVLLGMLKDKARGHPASDSTQGNSRNPDA